MKKRRKTVKIRPEKKFNTILNSISEQVCIIDKGLNIIWANAAAKKTFGKGIMGKKCYSVFNKSNTPCNLCPAITKLKGSKKHEYDTYIRDARGKDRYFHCTSNVISKRRSDKPQAVIEVSKDITRYKTARGLLLKSEEKYRGLAESLSELIYSADADKFFMTYVNSAVEKFYGYTPEDWLADTNLREKSIHAEDRKRVIAE
ncbi:MAG: PAS domain S-box protein, partial [Candidatus Omnitrophica bacterium]|nr:PAS domain S-box protein [Candidatus Omnitrophota bacterium]